MAMIVISLGGVLTFLGVQAGGQAPIDHDLEAAQKYFSTGEPCPTGTQQSVAEWEDNVAQAERISQGFGLEQAQPVMVDQVAVLLDDVPRDRPKDLAGPVVGVKGICVLTKDGLMDTGARIWIIDMPNEEGSPS